MKKTMRLLSVLLVVSMLFSTVAFAATFSDVSSDKKYYESVSVLSALGIITGYPDGSFGPEKNVTRAEFSVMLMRALASAGIGDPDPAGMPFADLGDASWAVSDIRTAYDLGIINGMSDIAFEPNSNVTYEQALKMVVCALNYGEHASQVQSTMPEGTPWYSGYMQVAGELKLVDGINYVLGQPAKRWEIAQIIYNAFDVYLLKKVELATGEVMYQQTTDTLLNSKLNVARAHGEIIADGPNTLAANGAVAREGFALICDSKTGRTYTYAKNDISLDGLLGRSVEFFYKTDVYGERQLIYFLDIGIQETSLVISANNLDVVTGTYGEGFSVTYYTSDTSTRTNTITVEPNAVIAVNGVVKNIPVAQDFYIENGEIEFINSNGKYTKVNVQAIETYVVKSVNKTDRYIVDMLRPTQANVNPFYIDYEDGDYVINMTNASGGELTINSLAAKNVLSVKTGQGAAGRIAYDIKVSTKTATGTIEELDVIDRKIRVNGSDYKISSYFVKYDTAVPSVLDSLSVRDSVKLYFDAYDQVVYAEKIASTSTFYGYVQFAAEDTSEGNVKLALVSKKVSKIGASYPVLAKKVRFNGVSKSAEQIPGLLGADEDNDYLCPQLIKYTVNSSGLVTDIETPETITDASEADEDIFQYYATNSTMNYDLTSKVFSGGDKSFRIDTSTEVFVVPTVASKQTVYARTTYSRFSTSTSYKVEAYDIDPVMKVAKAVVLYSTEAGAGDAPKPDETHPLFIIAEIKQEAKEGSARDLVKGYLIRNDGTVEGTADSYKQFYTASTGVMSGYEPGDIISYRTNSEGYVERASIYEILSVEDMSEGTKGDLGKRKVYAGLLKGVTDDGKSIVLVESLDLDDCAEDGGDITLGADSNTRVFTYGKRNNNVTITYEAGYDLTSITSYRNTNGIDASKIFVYTYKVDSKEKLRAIYIVQ